MKKNYKGIRGSDFVDIDFNDDNINTTPELMQREKYEFLVRSANNDFSSPLNKYQKTILNLLMMMHQTSLNYSVKQVIERNGYKNFDINMAREYTENVNKQNKENMCFAEEQVRKGNAWFDIEDLNSPIEQSLRTFSCKQTNNPKEWN